MFSATLADASWAEIRAISDSGKAPEYFSVGDEKNLTVYGFSGSFTGSSADIPDGLEQTEMTVILAGFNNHNVSDASPNYTITFITKGDALIAYTGSDSWVEGAFSHYLDNNYENIIPELTGLFKWVRVRTRISRDGGYVFVESMYHLFPPSAGAIGQNDSTQDDNTYEYFSSAQRRMLPSTRWSQGDHWTTRSTGQGDGNRYVVIRATGNIAGMVNTASSGNSYPLCFCI